MNEDIGRTTDLDGLCYSRRSELVLDIAELLANAFGGKNPVIQVEDLTVALQAVTKRGELKDQYFANLEKEEKDQ